MAIGPSSRFYRTQLRIIRAAVLAVIVGFLVVWVFVAVEAALSL
jgi:hypothetical protein